MNQGKKNIKMIENTFKHVKLMKNYIFVQIKDVSNSFDFCSAWTSACCRLYLDLCRRMWHRSSKKFKPQMMRVGKSDIGWPKCAGHTRCGHGTSYVKWLMWDAMENASRPCLMSTCACLHSKDDDGRPCLILVVHFLRPQTICATHVWLRLTVLCMTKAIQVGNIRR